PIFKGQRDGRIWFFSNPERLWASVRGQVEVTSNTAEKPSWREVFMQGVEGVRQHIGQATQGLAGGVVAALLMGNQRLVAAELREAYRAAGLSHLLAISGMQLTLVGLGVFWVIRRFLALFPVIVLRFDVKFWAAVVGLVAAGFYTLLAGAGVSVVRSLVMVALVMLAILVGRVRDALRAWCVAVVLIILIQPTMVMAAGFQLSIAAVLALILWAEREQVFENWPRWGWLVRVREVCLSSVVAGAATAPIVAWQFGQFSSVGLVANMLAIPLMALATYAGMVALALWPFGLEWLVLPPMAALVEVVNGWAVWLAGLQVLLHGSLYIEGWWVVFVAFMSVAMLVVVWYRLWVWLGVVMVLLVGGIGVAARLEMPLEMAVWDKGKVGIGCDAGGACRLAWAADAERAERLAVLAGVRLVPMAGEIPAKPDAAVAASLPTGNWNWAELRGGEWVVGRPSCAREWQNIAEECQVGWWK
ncbi:MAG: ComEC/Rec2 family competence protein, partial [Proteobacteria bacterium]|nr:ComEC/Rec2 family competence protein [Pseudomonadota bacterium]